MKLCVIGTGYVGLVAGACFAESGNTVICVDIDAAKIEGLRRGVVPIYEPGLKELIERNAADGRLFFSTDLAEAVRSSLCCFIAVGTPPGEDGSADLQHVLAVADAIGREMDGYKVVIDKSTVPVGTAEKVRGAIAARLAERREALEFDVVSNPEFLKEGSAIDDFLKPDRVIIGTDNVRTAELMKELYAPFMRKNNRVIVMDIKSAEMTKYAANAMLATRISFINQIANLCERLGADVAAVREGIGSDSRIGFDFLFPGVGYGGSCFPKDVRALSATARACGLEADLCDAAERVNLRQKTILVPKILRHLGPDPRGKTVAVWGLAFKPRTDDIREAPALALIAELLNAGVRVQAFDPEAMDNVRRVLGERIRLAGDEYAALAGAEALVLATEWNEFRAPDWERVKGLLKRPAVFDGRNIYDPVRLRALGFEYWGIGR